MSKLINKIKRFFGIGKYFDPIKEFLEEYEEHIYDGITTEDVMEKVRGNDKYIKFALAMRMLKSSEGLEKLTICLIILTSIMSILVIVQIVLLLI
jgi:hypothetical protein